MTDYEQDPKFQEWKRKQTERWIKQHSTGEEYSRGALNSEKWFKEIEFSPKFAGMSREERNAMRQQYFDKFVAPHASPEEMPRLQKRFNPNFFNSLVNGYADYINSINPIRSTREAFASRERGARNMAGETIGGGVAQFSGMIGAGKVLGTLAKIPALAQASLAGAAAPEALAVAQAAKAAKAMAHPVLGALTRAGGRIASDIGAFTLPAVPKAIADVVEGEPGALKPITHGITMGAAFGLPKNPLLKVASGSLVGTALEPYGSEGEDAPHQTLVKHAIANAAFVLAPHVLGKANKVLSKRSHTLEEQAADILKDREIVPIDLGTPPEGSTVTSSTATTGVVREGVKIGKDTEVARMTALAAEEARRANTYAKILADATNLDARAPELGLREKIQVIYKLQAFEQDCIKRGDTSLATAAQMKATADLWDLAAVVKDPKLTSDQFIFVDKPVKEPKLMTGEKPVVQVDSYPFGTVVRGPEGKSYIRVPLDPGADAPYEPGTKLASWVPLNEGTDLPLYMSADAPAAKTYPYYQSLHVLAGDKTVVVERHGYPSEAPPIEMTRGASLQVLWSALQRKPLVVNPREFTALPEVTAEDVSPRHMYLARQAMGPDGPWSKEVLSSLGLNNVRDVADAIKVMQDLGYMRTYPASLAERPNEIQVGLRGNAPRPEQGRLPGLHGEKAEGKVGYYEKPGQPSDATERTMWERELIETDPKLTPLEKQRAVADLYKEEMKLAREKIPVKAHVPDVRVPTQQGVSHYLNLGDGVQVTVGDKTQSGRVERINKFKGTIKVVNDLTGAEHEFSIYDPSLRVFDVNPYGEIKPGDVLTYDYQGKTQTADVLKVDHKARKIIFGSRAAEGTVLPEPESVNVMPAGAKVLFSRPWTKPAAMASTSPGPAEATPLPGGPEDQVRFKNVVEYDANAQKVLTSIGDLAAEAGGEPPAKPTPAQVMNFFQAINARYMHWDPKTQTVTINKTSMSWTKARHAFPVTAQKFYENNRDILVVSSQATPDELIWRKTDKQGRATWYSTPKNASPFAMRLSLSRKQLTYRFGDIADMLYANEGLILTKHSPEGGFIAMDPILGSKRQMSETDVAYAIKNSKAQPDLSGVDGIPVQPESFARPGALPPVIPKAGLSAEAWQYFATKNNAFMEYQAKTKLPVYRAYDDVRMTLRKISEWSRELVPRLNRFNKAATGHSQELFAYVQEPPETRFRVTKGWTKDELAAARQFEALGNEIFADPSGRSYFREMLTEWFPEVHAGRMVDTFKPWFESWLVPQTLDPGALLYNGAHARMRMVMKPHFGVMDEIVRTMERDPEKYGTWKPLVTEELRRYRSQVEGMLNDDVSTASAFMQKVNDSLGLDLGGSFRDLLVNTASDAVYAGTMAGRLGPVTSNAMQNLITLGTWVGPKQLAKGFARMCTPEGIQWAREVGVFQDAMLERPEAFQPIRTPTGNLSSVDLRTMHGQAEGVLAGRTETKIAPTPQEAEMKRQAVAQVETRYSNPDNLKQELLDKVQTLESNKQRMRTVGMDTAGLDSQIKAAMRTLRDLEQAPNTILAELKAKELANLELSYNELFSKEVPVTIEAPKHAPAKHPGLGKALLKTAQGTRKAVEVSMLPFRSMEHVNRAWAANTAYTAFTTHLPALQRGEITLKQFLRNTGATYLHKTAYLEFVQAMGGRSFDQARKLLARAAVDANHFVYEIGNSSKLLSTRMGRLFGTYGSWPTNFIIWTKNSFAANGDLVARAQWLKRYAATNAAILAAGASIFGVNLSQQVFLGPAMYEGGPWLDLLDSTRRMPGVAERALTGEGFYRDAQEWQNFKRGLTTIVPFGGMARDWTRAAEELPDWKEALRRVAGKRSTDR
jgi:hypothetical protein